MGKLNCVSVVVILEALTGIVSNIWSTQEDNVDESTKELVKLTLLIISILIAIAGIIVEICGEGGPFVLACADIVAWFAGGKM